MTMAGERYNRIGVGYQAARQADPRVEAQIHDALGDAQSILNVGAGTGNYEPTDRNVIALEPSPVMLGQRSTSNPTVRGVAEALPFADDAFDAAMGTFTVHHWADRNAGLRELRRVSRLQALLVYEQTQTMDFWLVEYFPWVAEATWEKEAPTAADLAEVLNVVEERRVMIPADCSDGFTGGYWNRPERYLDDAVQAGMSTLARLEPAQRAQGTQALRDALDSGKWYADHGHLLDEEWFDIGYRLVICTSD